MRRLVVEYVVSLHFDLRPVVPRDGGELLGELDHLVRVKMGQLGSVRVSLGQLGSLRVS